MIAEPFAAGNSWMHNIDPRMRVVFAGLYTIPVAVSDDFRVLFAALAFSLLLTILAGLSIAAVTRRLAAVFGFLLFLWLVLPWTVEGRPVWRVGPVVVTEPGLVLSAQITLKSVTILMSLIAMVATMSIAALGQALTGIGMSTKMVHLLLLTYRYVFVIESEYRRLVRAARVRRFKPGTNLHTYKTYAFLVGMLFVRASLRAERVHQAMKCRGFNGRFYSLREFPANPQNKIFFALMAAVVIAITALQWIAN